MGFGSFFKSIGHTIGNAVGTVYHDAKSFVSGTGHIISNTISGGQNIVNHVVQGTEKIAGKVVDKTASVVQTGEFALIIPLAAVGIGIAFLLSRSDVSQVAEVVKSAK